LPPGGSGTVSVGGCPPGSNVVLTVAGKQVGQATADDSGGFSAPIHIGSLPVGEYTVQAQCGLLATTGLTVALGSRIGGVTTTLLIILFVLLVGVLLYRRRLWPMVKRPSTEPTDPTEELS
jgi:hypothetical protein